MRGIPILTACSGALELLSWFAGFSVFLSFVSLNGQTGIFRNGETSAFHGVYSPLIDFCLPLWDPCNSNLRGKVDELLNATVRWIRGTDTTPRYELMKRYRLLNVQDRMDYFLASWAFKRNMAKFIALQGTRTFWTFHQLKRVSEERCLWFVFSVYRTLSRFGDFVLISCSLEHFKKVVQYEICSAAPRLTD